MTKPALLQSLHIVVFVLSLTLSNFSRAAYPVTPLLTEKLPNLVGSGFFTRDNTLYIYGGEERANSFVNTFSAIAFDNIGNVTYRTVPSSNGPQVAKPQLVLLPDNVTVLLLGGLYTDTMFNGSIPFRGYQYSFNDETWSPLSATQAGVDPATLPLNRQQHTAVLASNGIVYITGGVPVITIGEPVLIDSWSYNPSTGALARLQDPPIGLFGHTGTALPDGSIIYVGGYFNTTATGLAPMLLNSSAIYFPNNDTWIQQTLNADAIGSPSGARQLLSGVLGPEGRYIYYFGGDDYDQLYIREYFNDLWILDTKTFSWINPNVNGVRPQKRSSGVSGLITNEYAIFGFGIAGTDYLDVIDVLKLPDVDETTQDLDPSSAKWVSNVITGETLQQTAQTSGISKGVTAAVVIVCFLVALMCLFLIYRYRHRVKRLVMRIHYNFWSPRTGEPLWAETARLVSKIILLFLFIAFFVFVILQVIRSPKATYTVTEVKPGDMVEVPDVRVCFEGFDIVDVPNKPGRTYPLIECTTGAGELCFFNLVKLDLSKHSPWFMGNLGNNSCYLFLAGTSLHNGMDYAPVNLAPTTVPGVNNGTQIQFAFYPAPSQDNQTGRIHISFYPSDRDPLRQFYLDQSTPSLTENDITTWLRDDTEDFQVGNTVDILPNQVSYIEFQHERIEYLKDDGWNYVGFAPRHNSTSVVAVTSRTQDRAPGWQDTGGILTTAFISTASYTTLIHREQKIYSLVNAVGFIGGLFGLFVAFQAIMFGYRPQSPFGLVHRWSFGEMRSSISEGLKNRFSLSKTPVPLVNPVHNRYSINMRNYGRNYEDDEESTYIDDRSISSVQRMAGMQDEMPNYSIYGTDEAQRLASVEDRMQLLELLFKSYYVDDEVFRRLDIALKRPSDPEIRTARRSIGEYLRGTRPTGSLHPLSRAGNSVSAENQETEATLQDIGERPLNRAAVPMQESPRPNDLETR